jgi:hypothetical protein
VAILNAVSLRFLLIKAISMEDIKIRKICAICKIEKELSDFHKCADKRDGHSVKCKVCVAEHGRSKRVYKNGVKRRIMTTEERRIRERQQAKVYSQKWKEKLAATDKAYKKTPKGKRSQKNRHYYRNYKITYEEFELIRLNQENKCAICKKEFNIEGTRKDVPYVDRDHETGMVRGLLCAKCNLALGLVGDTLRSISKFVTYLENRYGALPP